MQNQYFSNRELERLDIHNHATFKYAGMGKDLVSNIEKIDIQNYLPGDILVKADRASMANSLELRAPFLDVGLATFLLRLPSALKIDKVGDKIILRRFVKDLLPKAVRNRKKQGFGIGSNIKYWMKDKKVQEIKSYYLSNTGQRIFDILPYSGVQKYLSRDNYKSWILLNFALWADVHQFSIK
jgi:asparagine synthase (glutamine-hydrolysing)